MNSSRNYLKYLDIIRVISLISVLMYHFNIIKGGFFAVCTFFVLSGYLSTLSAFKSEKFSLIDYYKRRFIKIYLPMLIVVFVSIIVISLIPNTNWFNLKPETTSIIASYNNFWQLDSNLDYFARQMDSPFIHFWYISILIQFELIFPFLFVCLKKIKEKLNRFLPCLILFIISIASLIYFYKTSDNIMFSYYNSLARSFSLLFGVLLGFIHTYYKPLIFKAFNDKYILKMIFYFYILILLILTQIIGFDSNYYCLTMILFTVISLRLIDYSYLLKDDKNSKILIYLIQYPIIYIFEYIEINIYLKYTLMVTILLVLSFILSFSLDIRNKNFKVLRRIILMILLSISIYGCYLFVKAEDHSIEMKELEELLNNNEKMMSERQKEYELNTKQEEEEWEVILNDLENGESKIKDIVSNLSIVGLGDSVMLGAVPSLYSKFKNGYFDAGISRTCYVADGIITKIKKKKTLGDVLVFNYGANGDCSESEKNKLLNMIGDKKLFWLTVTNDKKVHFNEKIKKYASKHDNMYIIDWEKISKGHSEYFYSDGIHLTPKGRKAYTNAIYEGIYEVYLNEYNEKKKEMINKYNEEMSNKVTFIGNELLTNLYYYMKDEFKNGNFISIKDNNINSIKKLIEESIKEDKLNNKVVFAFDNSINLTNKQYNELINLCGDRNIYIINLKYNRIFDKKVNVINYYEEIRNNKDYLMIDNIHLTETGNIALRDKLLQEINNKVE